MFEKVLLTSLPVLPMTNYEKGGDFMGLEQDNPARQNALEDAVRRMEWEGAPIPGEKINPTINPDQGTVLDGRSKPTHPLVRGKTRFDTALELAATGDPQRPFDWSLFRSVNGMDNGGE